jgi:hypothetical protein
VRRHARRPHHLHTRARGQSPILQEAHRFAPLAQMARSKDANNVDLREIVLIAALVSSVPSAIGYKLR